VKDQNGIQAMSKDLLKHMVVLARFQSAIAMRDKIDDQGLDMLSMYGQDDLRLSPLVNKH